jgi:DNA-binding CsgD family transcriptional regulator
VRLERAEGHLRWTVDALRTYAALAKRQGKAERAVRLLAAMKAPRAALGLPPMPWQGGPAYQLDAASLQEALDEAAFAAAWAVGEAMSWDETVAYALEEVSLPNEPAPIAVDTTEIAPDRTSAGLTAREVEVLRLVATGHNSREMAATLVISEATVTRHITNLYAKIGARSRADATAFAYQHQLVPTTALPSV